MLKLLHGGQINYYKTLSITQAIYTPSQLVYPLANTLKFQSANLSKRLINIRQLLPRRNHNNTNSHNIIKHNIFSSNLSKYSQLQLFKNSFMCNNSRIRIIISIILAQVIIV